jgi:hypothetical protein
VAGRLQRSLEYNFVKLRVSNVARFFEDRLLFAAALIGKSPQGYKTLRVGVFEYDLAELPEDVCIRY